MGSWKDILGESAARLDDVFDQLVFNFRNRMGSFRPLQIVPFRSYGTRDRLYIKGRVLEDRKIKAATDQDNVWNNLVNMYKRFESDEVPGAVLRTVIEGQELTVITDSEGYFVLDIHPSAPLISDSLWYSIALELQHAPVPHGKGIVANAEVMIPPPDAEYGIISDIDDTIIRTSATDLLAMGRTTFLNNARTRLPFAGVSEFYRSLQLGRNGKRNNPFFYVSSSPWNLYDLLIDFLDLNGIPGGPLLLRDFGINSRDNKSGGHLGHKLKEIRQIMDSYPKLPFVLVGDSGQDDPAIYQEVVKQYPDRILAIYIRDVQLPEREKIALDVSRALSEARVEMVIVDNTVEAAEHASKLGLIYHETLPVIEQEKAKDKGQQPGKQDPSVFSG